MINEVIIEGIAIKNWKYLDDLFVRLASYRDPDLPNRPYDAVRDLADYINVRLPGQARSAMNFTRGMRVRVHGFLQSRDYAESLEDFLRRARPANAVQLNSTQTVTTMRSIHEIVAQRVVVLDIASSQSVARDRKKIRVKSPDGNTAQVTSQIETEMDNAADINDEPDEVEDDLIHEEEITEITAG